LYALWALLRVHAGQSRDVLTHRLRVDLLAIGEHDLRVSAADDADHVRIVWMPTDEIVGVKGLLAGDVADGDFVKLG
jgi:hypothetical protein